MTGEVVPYTDGAACIRVQAGDNIVIRNNKLENCENGIFTMSQPYGEAHLTRNILVEGNYVHRSGQPGSYLEHAMYIQSIGATIQNNRFGANAQSTLGTTLKTRSAGVVIRYNSFEGGSARALDLVEVEDAKTWYIEQAYLDWAAANGGIDPLRLEKVKAAETAYKSTHVYGNLIRHVGSQGDSENIIHFGADHAVPYPLERTLYFYNNTVSVLNDLNDSYRFRLFYIGDRNFPGYNETLEVFNNIFHIASKSSQTSPSFLCMGEGNAGSINFGVNWLTNRWSNETELNECYNQYYPDQPIVTGAENLININGLAIPIDPNNLLPITANLNQSQPLPAFVGGYPVLEQYEPEQKTVSRSTTDTLGAIELLP